ncbi:MAG: hypothetical protein HYY18_07090 [Planctomycetes bacterium]|nr:hypothetical protein [Planctomycetota bacterium]
MKDINWTTLLVRGTLISATLMLAVNSSPAWLLLTAWCAIGSLSSESNPGKLIPMKTAVDLGLTAGLAGIYLVVR